MTLLVTGGAGFIGSNYLRARLGGSDEPVVNLDALAYAGSTVNIDGLRDDPRHHFVRGDVCDAALVAELLAAHRPRAVVHFAAESHVDRSILGPGAFLRSNVEGTYVLLETARAYWSTLPEASRAAFRLLHVSTDEVYGSLPAGEPPADERHAYAPSSPYSASKAAADHLVHAWHRTYGLPVLQTHCSNNYGPGQLPDKLIPRLLVCALAGEPMPLYGDGLHERDWLHVDDHVDALHRVLAAGRPGARYNVASGAVRTNRAVVDRLCDLLDELRPDPAGSYHRLVRHVDDRPGHDRRYAVDARRVRDELGWTPRVAFDDGMRRTVQWMLAHPEWRDAAVQACASWA